MYPIQSTCRCMRSFPHVTTGAARTKGDQIIKPGESTSVTQGQERANGGSMTDWGLVSRKKIMNPFVTLDALYVLRAAGRLRINKTFR